LAVEVLQGAPAAVHWLERVHSGLGGRWHRPSDALVHASASLALAAMERFVHLGEDGLHIPFVSFRIDIPGTVQGQHCRRAPAGWRDEPPQEPSMRCGSAWLRRGNTVVRVVPSAIVPSQSNVLLNPLHPDFGKIRIGRVRPFAFDPRMRRQAAAR